MSTQGTDWRLIVDDIADRAELAELPSRADTFREHALEDVRTLLGLVSDLDDLIAQQTAMLGVSASRGTVSWREHRRARRECAREAAGLRSARDIADECVVVGAP